MAGSGTTLLSYEMSWQLKLFELATNSQQANDYVMACSYMEDFLIILGLKDKIPEKNITTKSGNREEIMSLQNHFMILKRLGTVRIGDTIQSVRNNPKYNKSNVVPVMAKPGELRND